jgi:23S rRNA pseudouridine2605 synthase
VTYGDSNVKSERKVYLLLNKPKDYITTVDDPRDRKTVMELIKGACRERVYPVGRLDRNTTGLLLFTNDGELTTKLTHPKFGVKKVYHVSLNKGLKPADLTAIVEGVELEDGLVKADDLAFVGEGKKEIGIEIHSGRNRIVRRLFEHLGYDVLKLDRVVFAGLTKKDLPRGKHRFLTAKEIGFLQMIG